MADTDDVRKTDQGLVEDDVRRVVPDWSAVEDLIQGARARGWPEDHVNYLLAVVGVTWSKATHAATKKERERGIPASTLVKWVDEIAEAARDLETCHHRDLTEVADATMKDLKTLSTKIEFAYLARLRLECE